MLVHGRNLNRRISTTVTCQVICAASAAQNPAGFQASLAFVIDPAFAGLSPEEVAALLRDPGR
ncbi:hypothetical protein [Cryptosporangium sp. NPDC048952]|uniref:hypothetical protein n=1 Tax=Cryptosporangium sp. NPDC048952 TaxID=3363961 RepID=UPI00371101DB